MALRKSVVIALVGVLILPTLAVATSTHSVSTTTTVAGFPVSSTASGTWSGSTLTFKARNLPAGTTRLTGVTTTWIRPSHGTLRDAYRTSATCKDSRPVARADVTTYARLGGTWYGLGTIPVVTDCDLDPTIYSEVDVRVYSASEGFGTQPVQVKHVFELELTRPTVVISGTLTF